jgi:hydrogenase maturation protease
MKKTLIIGYGNPDRQDDGVAWHILATLTGRLGRTIPASYMDGIYPTGDNPDMLFSLQLLPEMADMFADYQRVCFVDAHTGSIPEELQFKQINAYFQNSPLTHHLTPESCLALADTLHGTHPESILVSVRGFEFDFESNLSKRTSELSEEAVTRIWGWLHNTN